MSVRSQPEEVKQQQNKKKKTKNKMILPLTIIINLFYFHVFALLSLFSHSSFWCVRDLFLFSFSFAFHWTWRDLDQVLGLHSSDIDLRIFFFHLILSFHESNEQRSVCCRCHLIRFHFVLNFVWSMNLPCSSIGALILIIMAHAICRMLTITEL